MLRYGAWIHSGGLIDLNDQVKKAAAAGLSSVRSYSPDYTRRLVPGLQETGLSLMAGLHVDAEALVTDWKSQVDLASLAQYHQLGINLEAICVGNELREFGDHPDRKRFTARLSFALANVLHAYKDWLNQQGLATPLTYAMEGIVFGENGQFMEHLWPLVDALDVISLNLYPMGKAAWHGPTQFEESRLLLQDRRTRNNRFLQYEFRLRQVLDVLDAAGKSLILSETGFPSAIAGHRDETNRMIPEHDLAGYAEAMDQFLGMISRVAADYPGRIRMVYFYEWHDNPFHSKIDNIEDSPIHSAFGLCELGGKPKLDIKSLLDAHR